MQEPTKPTGISIPKRADPVAQPNPIRTPADLAATLQQADPNKVVEPGPVNRHEMPGQPKAATEHVERDMKSETLSSVLGRRVQAAEARKVVRFIARFPELILYVNMGATDREPGGQLIRKDEKIAFKGGVYETTDKRIAQMIRQHPQCGSTLFREEDNETTAALRRAAAVKQASMRNPTFSGPTSSLDGGEAAIMRGMHDLDALETNLMKGG